MTFNDTVQTARREPVWDDYPLLGPSDAAKHDLELVHTQCGERLCDAEHGDLLSTLASMVTDHDATCPKRRSTR
ncbi:hypothetical protein [Streptomyces bacillaris]|uniref:hypothetical protein n=1 Tax=Streptomyces bacillaris TaxID=68179 RepID=UPI003821C776